MGTPRVTVPLPTSSRTVGQWDTVTGQRLAQRARRERRGLPAVLGTTGRTSCGTPEWLRHSTISAGPSSRWGSSTNLFLRKQEVIPNQRGWFRQCAAVSDLSQVSAATEAMYTMAISCTRHSSNRWVQDRVVSAGIPFDVPGLNRSHESAGLLVMCVVTGQMVGDRQSPEATILGGEIAYLFRQPSPAGPADWLRTSRCFVLWTVYEMGGPVPSNGYDVAASFLTRCRGSRNLRPRRCGTSLSDVSATHDVEASRITTLVDLGRTPSQCFLLSRNCLSRWWYHPRVAGATSPRSSWVWKTVEFGSQLFAALPRAPEAASHSLHWPRASSFLLRWGGEWVSVVTLNRFSFKPLGASLLGPASSWPA